MEGRLQDLLSIQRTGSRGRIFLHLVRLALRQTGASFQAEPIFDPVPPHPWYVSFATENEIKLDIQPFYNPDFLLGDGTWLEATLSENTAYKKLFSHGHQSGKLVVIWLNEDTGRHREICKNVAFPNASVLNIRQYFSCLDGPEWIALSAKFDKLKELKAVVL